MSVELPPLRERKEDIPYLVNFFIDKFSKEYGRNVKGISPSAMKLLLEYSYPGNVRELENIIESAVVVCRGSVIREEDLPEEIGSTSYSPVPRSSDEADRIREALKQAGGNKSLAAKLLGIHRTTLWRKMRELGIG
ncbi:MAG: helix-turn-helix domain-containing protein [Aquificota bacterium]|nr:helix-turn-helix domain-containing protein [Aquificota bacterium]